jgi:hypothetical protein
MVNAEVTEVKQQQQQQQQQSVRWRLMLCVWDNWRACNNHTSRGKSSSEVEHRDTDFGLVAILSPTSTTC